MTLEFRIRELEEDQRAAKQLVNDLADDCLRHKETIADQRTTILFLAKMLGKAWAERDHARDVAVAAEVEVARLTGWESGR